MDTIYYCVRWAYIGSHQVASVAYPGIFDRGAYPIILRPAKPKSLELLLSLIIHIHNNANTQA